MKILPVLGVTTDDADQAESLLDWMKLLRASQRTRYEGDAQAVQQNWPSYFVLAFSPDVHGERKNKITITAQVVFDNVDVVNAVWPAEAYRSKPEGINHLFRTAAKHVMANYKTPFAWLEPDSIPLTKDWLEWLEAEYEVQPKLYMGAFGRDAAGRRSLNRIAVYPRFAAQDLSVHLDTKTAPFEQAAGEALAARANKTQLVYFLPINQPGDVEKVRAGSVLVHGDKRGILLSKLMSEEIVASKARAEKPESMIPEIKVDGRTKAGKAAKASLETTVNA